MAKEVSTEGSAIGHSLTQYTKNSSPNKTRKKKRNKKVNKIIDYNITKEKQFVSHHYHIDLQKVEEGARNLYQMKPPKKISSSSQKRSVVGSPSTRKVLSSISYKNQIKSARVEQKSTVKGLQNSCNNLILIFLDLKGSILYRKSESGSSEKKRKQVRSSLKSNVLNCLLRENGLKSRRNFNLHQNSKTDSMTLSKNYNSSMNYE
jgi:hypothetical protein